MHSSPEHATPSTTVSLARSEDRIASTRSEIDRRCCRHRRRRRATAAATRDRHDGFSRPLGVFYASHRGPPCRAKRGETCSMIARAAERRHGVARRTPRRPAFHRRTPYFHASDSERSRARSIGRAAACRARLFRRVLGALSSQARRAREGRHCVFVRPPRTR